MLTESQRKMLVEWMGEKWQEDISVIEWEYRDSEGADHYTTIDPENGTSPKTRRIMLSKHNRTFTIEQDKADLARKISEKGDWGKFEEDISDIGWSSDIITHSEWLMTMQPEGFAELVYAWLT